ncbi:MAG: alpha/beta fold hydrolase [Dehalococcoidia bacterium]
MTATPMVRYAHASDGMHIAYTVTGAGPLFVRMPGVVVGLARRGCRLAAQFADEAERHFRMIEYDARGHGLSTRGITSFTLDDTMRDLEAVLAATHADNPILFATGQQAPAALRYAAEHPGATAAVVLFDPFPFGEHSANAPAAILLARSNFAAVLELTLAPDADGPGRELLESQAGMITPEDFIVMTSDHIHRDPRPWIDQVTAPILLIQTWAASHTPEERDRVAGQLPAARRVLLPGRRPYPYGENLLPAFAAIEEFLRESHSVAPASATHLTVREKEILVALASGNGNRTIAENLSLSEKTVARHVANIYQKLGVHNRAQATSLALGATGHDPLAW